MTSSSDRHGDELVGRRAHPSVREVGLFAIGVVATPFALTFLARGLARLPLGTNYAVVAVLAVGLWLVFPRLRTLVVGIAVGTAVFGAFIVWLVMSWTNIDTGQ